ncbi:unnamed protein product [Effrenium voratum]|nr:unnamed protein product [Effrenium voratum]
MACFHALRGLDGSPPAHRLRPVMQTRCQPACRLAGRGLRPSARCALLAVPLGRLLRRAVTIDVVREHPLIWVVDGLCSDRRVRHLQQLVDQEDGLQKTDAYVDDMFDERREQHEDAELLVALVGTGALQFVPEQYHRDPLRCFLWIAQTRPELLARGDWKRGACAARRRAWCTHWNPEDLVRSGFRQRAARCQAPKAALELLAPLAREVLGAPVRGLHREEAQLPRWALRDTTVVRYKPEESQVPHIDTSDVTMLLYLSDAGGRTCFPHLGCSVQPRRGRVLVFCSTQPRAACRWRVGRGSGGLRRRGSLLWSGSALWRLCRLRLRGAAGFYHALRQPNGGAARREDDPAAPLCRGGPVPPLPLLGGGLAGRCLATSRAHLRLPGAAAATPRSAWARGGPLPSERAVRERLQGRRVTSEEGSVGFRGKLQQDLAIDLSLVTKSRRGQLREDFAALNHSTVADGKYMERQAYLRDREWRLWPGLPKWQVLTQVLAPRSFVHLAMACHFEVELKLGAS